MDKVKEQKERHRVSDKGKKCYKIGDWKRMGVIESSQYTYDELYDTYLYWGYCEICDVKLTTGRKNTSTTKCLDHDHETGLFRYIVCLACNNKLGK